MRIRAILRFRNEELTRKRLIAGFKTQKELAEFLGINIANINQWETFRNYPKKKEHVTMLESALNCEIDEIFPPEFIKAIEKKIGIPLEKIVDMKQLPGFTRGELLLTSPEDVYEIKEMANSIEDSLKSLTERETKILKMRFGLGDDNEHSFFEVAKFFKVTRERIRQIEAKALRKLKHPARSRNLRSLIKPHGFLKLQCPYCDSKDYCETENYGACLTCFKRWAKIMHDVIQGYQ